MMQAGTLTPGAISVALSTATFLLAGAGIGFTETAETNSPACAYRPARRPDVQRAVQPALMIRSLMDSPSALARWLPSGVVAAVCA